MPRTSCWFRMELVQTLGKQNQSTSFYFTQGCYMGQARTAALPALQALMAVKYIIKNLLFKIKLF